MIEKDQETLPFPTTANQKEKPVIDTSPEGLKKLVEEGTPQVLQLVNRNRREGAEQLRNRMESLDTELQLVEKWRRTNLKGLMVVTDLSGETVFSLENSLLNIQRALDGVSSYCDAQNSLMDMLINDIIGMVKNMNAAQHAIMVSNGQCQTLITLLINKGAITDNEMKETWNILLQDQKEQMRKEAGVEAPKEPLQPQDDSSSAE